VSFVDRSSLGVNDRSSFVNDRASLLNDRSSLVYDGKSIVEESVDTCSCKSGEGKEKPEKEELASVVGSR
jgi:hypothetical protein